MIVQIKYQMVQWYIGTLVDASSDGSFSDTVTEIRDASYDVSKLPDNTIWKPKFGIFILLL